MIWCFVAIVSFPCPVISVSIFVYLLSLFPWLSGFPVLSNSVISSSGPCVYSFCFFILTCLSVGLSECVTSHFILIVCFMRAMFSFASPVSSVKFYSSECVFCVLCCVPQLCPFCRISSCVYLPLFYLCVLPHGACSLHQAVLLVCSNPA